MARRRWSSAGPGRAGRRRFGAPIITLALIAAACAPGTPGASVRPSVAPGTAFVDALLGDVRVTRPADATTGAPATPGPLEAGLQVATGREAGAHLVLADGSRIRLGSFTTLTLTSLPGGPGGPSTTRVQMGVGSAWFVLVGAGPMEVTMPFGISSVTGSQMSIAIDGFGRSTTTCVEGHCRVVNAAGAISLTAARQGSIHSVSTPPLFEGAVEIERCNLMLPDCPFTTYGPTEPPTPTPAPSRPPATRTPTPTAFVLPSGATPTPAIPGIADLPSPNPSAPVGSDGLTPEERANQGAHAYQFGCQSFNRCECNLEAVGQTITITFVPGKSATLAAGGESITYERVAPSTYRWSSGTTVATITFSLLGWTFDTRRDGQACAIQTFRLP